MRYLTLLAVLSLIMPLASCMHYTKDKTSTSQCRHLIGQAQNLYTHQTHHTRTATQAANLITAAKISDEKQEYITCIDKADRAIELLDPNSRLSLQPGH